MALIPFKCPSCEFTDDYLQKSDDPAPKCPRCKKRMNRNYAGSSFLPEFVGDGFHSNDYKPRLKPKGERYSG